MLNRFDFARNDSPIGPVRTEDPELGANVAESSPASHEAPGQAGRFRSLARNLIPVIFAFSACAIVGLGTLACYLFERSQQTDALVLHTAITIGKLERFHVTLIEAESAGRAFLVSAAPQFKAAYERALVQIDDEARDVERAVDENPQDHTLFTDLQQNIARRFAYLDAIMTIRARQGIDALLGATVGSGIREMEVIRNRIEDIKRIQRRRLTERQAMQVMRDQSLQLGLQLLMVVGVGVLGGLFWYLHVTSLARDRAEAIALHQAQHDALTGLPNRRLLNDRLTNALAQGRREQIDTAVLCLDLDGFKHVNDEHGHDAGDALLIEVGCRLAQLVRSTDTVARIGGDEFVVTLFPVRDTAEVGRVLERIVKSIAAPYTINGQQLTIGTSVGKALSSEHGATLEELIRHADTDLYAAKRSRIRSGKHAAVGGKR